jgi:hypothetical protein
MIPKTNHSKSYYIEYKRPNWRDEDDERIERKTVHLKRTVLKII